MSEYAFLVIVEWLSSLKQGKAHLTLHLSAISCISTQKRFQRCKYQSAIQALDICLPEPHRSFNCTFTANKSSLKKKKHLALKPQFYFISFISFLFYSMFILGHHWVNGRVLSLHMSALKPVAHKSSCVGFDYSNRVVCWQQIRTLISFCKLFTIFYNYLQLLLSIFSIF